MTRGQGRRAGRPGAPWLRLALGLALLGWLAQPAQAQRVIRLDPEALTAALPGGGDGIGTILAGGEREQLRRLLLEWRQSVDEGNAAAARDLLPDMKRLLDLAGFQDRGTLVGGLVAMGRDWVLLEDWTRAELAYEAARELDPEHGPTHLALGELALARDGGVSGAIGLLAGVVKSTIASLSTLRGSLRLLANLAAVALIAGLVAVAALAVVLMAKYNRLLRHGAREALAERLPGGLDRVVAWLLVFVPVVFFLPPPWWVAYWLVVFRSHGTTPERRLCVVALVVLTLTPPAFHLVTRLGALQKDPVLAAADALDRRDVTPTVVGQMAGAAERLDTPEAYFLVGQLYAAVGRPDDSIAAYNAAIDRDSRFARAINNRANQHFRRGDRQTAIVDYKLATDKDRTLAMAWRNGSIAYTVDLKTDLASDWQRRAQQLDPDGVRQWREQVGQTGVVDAELTRGELWQMARATQSATTEGSVLRALVSSPSLAGGLGLLVILLPLGRVLAGLEASACEKCGRAFCSRCHASAKTSAYCTQCVHLYVKKDGVSPVVRSAKLREVERWVAINSIATRLFNILLPGAGSIYGNRVVAGSFLVFLWAAALTALLVPAHLLMAPERLGHADLTVLFALELMLLVGVYLLALVQSLRHAG